MIRLTVSRHDTIYECFPDIAQAADGTLVCVYRECMGHSAFPFSRLVVRRSFDNGMNWDERRIIMECATDDTSIEEHRVWLEADAIAGYEETRARNDNGGNERLEEEKRIDCPRVICLQSGILLLAVNIGVRKLDETRFDFECPIWQSHDHGATWDHVETTPRLEGFVLSLLQLKNGDILLGVGDNFEDNHSHIYRSSDDGRTWSGSVSIPYTDHCLPGEISYVELDDGTIVGFGRNIAAERSHVPSTGVKVVSRDGGKSWDGPFETWLMGCQGRPKAGLLRSGEVCVTYRCCIPNEFLAMHLMSQDACKSAERGEMIERVAIPEDVAAKAAEEKGIKRPSYMNSYYPGRTVILDSDRSVHRDQGYSGWIQRDDGSLYVVDYINDDAPLAHIRGYIVNRSDIVLFPEGDLPWVHPSAQPYRAITQAMAKKQKERNCSKG